MPFGWTVPPISRVLSNKNVFIRQAKLDAGIDFVPGANSGAAQAIDFNARKSESELPLTATFHNPGYQQWDNTGRAVGYAPDPMLYAPRPQRPTRVGSPSNVYNSSGQSSVNPTPVTGATAGAQPVRQNTNSSDASWDAQAHVGGSDVYPMTRSPAYSTDRPSVPRIAPPTTQPLSLTSKSPKSAVTRKPVPAAPSSAPGMSSGSPSEPTPTQTQFANADHPHSAPLPNPFANPTGAPQLPSQTERGQRPEGTEPSYYNTTYGGYSQNPSSSDDSYYDPYGQQTPTRR